MIIISVAGFAIHFYDFYMPRVGTIRALIPAGIVGNGENDNGTNGSEDSYRRGGLLIFGIAFVGIFGVLLALVAIIIFLVTVGIKNITFVTWLYNPVYMAFWMASAYSTIMIFMPVRKSKGALEVGALVLWIVAFAFSIAGAAIYGIIWDRCIFNKGTLTTGEKAICDNEKWLVWVLFIFAVWNLIHTALGVIVHIWDFLARRRPTAGGFLGSLGLGRRGNGNGGNGNGGNGDPENLAQRYKRNLRNGVTRGTRHTKARGGAATRGRVKRRQ